MLNPSDAFKKTIVLTPIEKKFQSGTITENELKDIWSECEKNSEKSSEIISQYIGLMKHMKDEAVDTVGALLYKIDAEKNPQLVLRGDNIARAFAVAHCSRVLGNKKDEFIEKTLKSIQVSEKEVVNPNTKEITKKEVREGTIHLNSDNLKSLIPPLIVPLETCINRLGGKPGDEVQKKALHDLIAFNLIKPVILKGREKDFDIVRTTFKLDKTVVDTLFSEYSRVKGEKAAITASKKEQVAPSDASPLKPPAPEKAEKPTEPPPGPAKPKKPEQDEGRPNQGLMRRRP